MINELIELFFHLDTHLAQFSLEYGLFIYVLLFMIIFIETGIVIMPFLPGDSLLFTAGALAALGNLDISLLLILLTIAAIAGDSINYTLGRSFGSRFFTNSNSIIFNKNHLIKTQQFYEKHGSNTIIIARFIPIIRTFAPFVAGIANMHYPRFLLYNILGGILWVFLFVIGGYLFGNIPLVKENFGFVILAIIIISLLPLIISLLKNKG
ncbi:MAG: hypothetical protein RL557_994 [archaeon]|jgi:membrane-associated protein